MENRYLIVGAGGTGTHLLPPLLAYLNAHVGSFRLGVMDGDEVEQKNFARQLFDPSTTHMNKAKAALFPYRGMNNLIAIPDYLSDENISDIILDGTTVLICVDNMIARARIEKHCETLDNVVVINGGNEEVTGSCQIWIRKNGVNVTPKLSFLHQEILAPGPDRALMSCQEVAELPGGEQLIVANMASALYILTALMKVHRDEIKWTESQFDLWTGMSYGIDQRESVGWS